MELRHLRYFIAVAEEENVSRAAAKLHVAQPSLSRQIRDLEDQVGVPLFQHSARAVRLTDAGRFFLSEAREVIACAERATESLRAFAQAKVEEIHVGYAPSLTTKVLPATLRAFHEASPQTRVRLHDLSTEAMLSGLREETLDAALLVKPSTAALNGLAFQTIARYRPCVALSPTHSLNALPVLRAQDLTKEKLLTYNHTEYPEYRSWLDRVFQGAPPPRIEEEYDDATSLIAAIESGCGVAVVQDGFENLAGPRLVVRPVKGARAATFAFGVAKRKDDNTPATRAFLAAATMAAQPPA